MVKITVGGSYWEGITYTNEFGCFYISFQNIWYIGSGKITATLYLDNGESIKVVKNGTYAYSFDVVEGQPIFKHFTPSSDGDFAKSIMIFEFANSYANFAKILRDGNPFRYCKYEFPANESSCQYLRGGKDTVQILNLKGPGSYPNCWCCADVIGHEYGHHLQEYYKISNNPGGQHTVPGNNMDDQWNTTLPDGSRKYDLFEAKDRGMRLSWGEGWPTFWSTMAQQTFPNDLKSMPYVNDTKYTSYRGFEYEIDSYGDSTYKPYGDADELSVQRILFKLNLPKKDSFDDFSIDFRILWNLVIENKPHTFASFVNVLYEKGYNKYKLARLLSQYKVVTSFLNHDPFYLDMKPLFKWSTDSGSTNFSYDRTILYFLDKSNKVILEKDVYCTSTMILTDSEWKTVLSDKNSEKIRVTLRLSNIVGEETGKYYSEIFEVDKPVDFKNKCQIKPNEWGFESQYYFESNKKGHDTTVKTVNGLKISTNRLRCGYIENSYVVLSPRRKNAGKAYLELNFDKPVYQFLYGILLWSYNEQLDAGNCTAVIETKDSYGNWHIDRNLLKDTVNPLTDFTRRYISTYPDGIYGLRFVSTAPAIGDRNKGRICLDDIVLNTNKDVLFPIYSTCY